MKKEIMMKIKSSQRRGRLSFNGFTLIELMIVLAITAYTAIAGARQLRSYLLDLQAQTAADNITVLGRAVATYIPKNTAALSGVVYTDLTIPQLVADNDLSASYVGMTPWGSGYKIRIQRVGVAPNYLYKALVFTSTPWVIDTVTRLDLVGSAVKKIGGAGGMTYKTVGDLAKDAPTGSGGAWTEPTNTFAPPVPYDPKGGQLFYNVAYSLVNLDALYLRRDGGNNMQAALQMNTNGIVGATTIDASGLITSDSLTSTNAINGGSIATSGAVTAIGTVTGGALTTTGAVSAGTVTATGDIISTTGAVKGDTLVATGLPAPGTGCPVNGSVAQSSVGSGMLVCLSGAYRQLAMFNTPGDACIDGTMSVSSGAGSKSQLLCINSTFQSLDTLFRSGSTGGACPALGATAIDTAANNATLVCRNNPGTNVQAYARLQDITTNLSFGYSYEVMDGNNVPAPSCNAGGTPIIQLIPKTFSSPNGGQTFFATGTGPWTVYLKDGDGNSLMANSKAVAQTYCYYP